MPWMWFAFLSPSISATPVPHSGTHTEHRWVDGRYARRECTEVVGARSPAGEWRVRETCGGEERSYTAFKRRGALYVQPGALTEGEPTLVFPRRVRPGATWSSGRAICTATAAPPCSNGVAARCEEATGVVRTLLEHHHCPGRGSATVVGVLQNDVAIREMTWITEKETDGEPWSSTDPVAVSMPLRAAWSQEHCPADEPPVDDLVRAPAAAAGAVGPWQRVVVGDAVTLDGHTELDPEALTRILRDARGAMARIEGRGGLQPDVEVDSLGVVVPPEALADAWVPWVRAIHAADVTVQLEVAVPRPELPFVRADTAAATLVELQGLAAGRAQRVTHLITRMIGLASEAGCLGRAATDLQRAPLCGRAAEFVEHTRERCSPGDAAELETLAQVLAAELGTVGAIPMRRASGAAVLELPDDLPFRDLVSRLADTTEVSDIRITR